MRISHILAALTLNLVQDFQVAVFSSSSTILSSSEAPFWKMKKRNFSLYLSFCPIFFIIFFCLFLSLSISVILSFESWNLESTFFKMKTKLDVLILLFVKKIFWLDRGPYSAKCHVFFCQKIKLLLNILTRHRFIFR